MHAERLILRPKTQHTSWQTQRTFLVEEVQMAGKLRGDRIEVEIPHRARAERRVHVKNDAPARLGLKADSLAETLRGLRAVTGVLDPRAVQGVGVELVVDEEQVEA